jgi:hypothetical protein
MYGLFESFAEMDGVSLAHWVLRFSGRDGSGAPAWGAGWGCWAAGQAWAAVREALRPAAGIHARRSYTLRSILVCWPLTLRPLPRAPAGPEQSCPDPQAFVADVAAFFERLTAETAATGATHGADALADVLELVRTHQVNMPGHICATGGSRRMGGQASGEAGVLRRATPGQPVAAGAAAERQPAQPLAAGRLSAELAPAPLCSCTIPLG